MINQTNSGKDILASVLGLRCSNVERVSDLLWRFSFGSGDRTGALTVECPWRLVVNGNIIFGDRDQGQRFGREDPVDGPRHCMRLISGQTVNDVDLRPDTGDISFVFENDCRLEVFSNSSGFEAWSFSMKGGKTLTSLGGGGLAAFSPA